MSGSLRFISDNFVYLAGIIGIFGYSYEIYHNIKRKGVRKKSDNLKTVIFLSTSIVSMFLAFYLFQANYESRHETTIAADLIESANDTCLAKVEDSKATASGGNNGKALLCFAYAFQKYGPKQSPEAVSARFYQDVELGNKLLSNATIADTLKKYFGIKRDSFLGTGYSLPSAKGETSPVAYGDVRTREYLVLNSCAERMPLRGKCKSRNDTAWAWRLLGKELDTLNVEDVVHNRPPTDGGAEYKEFLENWDKGRYDGPLLIRFAKVPIARYVGTVGRPEAAYVFFTSYEDVKNLSLREAFRLSGATEGDLAEVDNSQALLVWISAPFGAGEHRYLATWSNLFYLLRKVEVSDDVKNATGGGMLSSLWN